jgi:hypothetical protein
MRLEFASESRRFSDKASVNRRSHIAHLKASVLLPPGMIMSRRCELGFASTQIIGRYRMPNVRAPILI